MPSLIVRREDCVTVLPPPPSLSRVENLSAVGAEDKRSKADREALLPKSTELIECVPELSNR